MQFKERFQKVLDGMIFEDINVVFAKRDKNNKSVAFVQLSNDLLSITNVSSIHLPKSLVIIPEHQNIELGRIYICNLKPMKNATGFIATNLHQNTPKIEIDEVILPLFDIFKVDVKKTYPSGEVEMDSFTPKYVFGKLHPRLNDIQNEEVREAYIRVAKAYKENN